MDERPTARDDIWFLILMVVLMAVTTAIVYRKVSGIGVHDNDAREF